MGTRRYYAPRGRKPPAPTKFPARRYNLISHVELERRTEASARTPRATPRRGVRREICGTNRESGKRALPISIVPLGAELYDARVPPAAARPIDPSRRQPAIHHKIYIRHNDIHVCMYIYIYTYV
jgi:hypothetical protein